MVIIKDEKYKLGLTKRKTNIDWLGERLDMEIDVVHLTNDVNEDIIPEIPKIIISLIADNFTYLDSEFNKTTQELGTPEFTLLRNVPLLQSDVNRNIENKIDDIINSVLFKRQVEIITKVNNKLLNYIIR